ncbi:MAG: hypothetical protein ACKO9S_05470 [Bacteroidota bacterium]
MKPFLKKLFRFLAPILVLLAIFLILYAYNDPFKVLRPYADYSYSSVFTNRDFVSTSMFIKQYPKNKYNSFIFGSSRTMAYRPEIWGRYLDDDSRVFVFDAAGESVYGIYHKLKYLDAERVELKNALIVLCRDFAFRHDANHEGHLYIKHPATSGESGLAFQYEFLSAYFSPKFLFNYYAFQVLGEYKPFMSVYIENRRVVYDTITNGTIILDQEEELKANEEAYYANRAHIFYERVGEKTDSVQRINPKHEFMLREIKRLLDKNKTQYKVVLSPLYDQTKFNPADMSILNGIFRDYLYDFTGKNAITDNKFNYYEISHYRYAVGDSILSNIYK